MNTSSLIRAVVLFLLLFSLCPTQSVRSQVLQSNQVEVVEVTKSENRQGDSNNASDSKQKQIVVMNLFYDGLDQDFLDKLMYYFGVWMQSGFNDFLLVIDSSGGDLDTGIAAYNYLSSLPITLRTHNISQTSSAAILIYCAGDIRTASENSSFLIHDGTINMAQNLTPLEVRSDVEHWEMKKEFSRNIFSKCTGVNDSETKSIFAAESVFDASKARSLGLVHEVRDITSELTGAFILPIGLENWPRDFR